MVPAPRSLPRPLPAPAARADGLGPRRIVTADVPGPESVRLLARAAAQEGPAVARQPTIAWRRARGVHVEDVDGNVLLDFTSSVLVANVGHAHPRVVSAIRAQAEDVVHAYNFVHPWRVELERRLLGYGAPHGLDRVFLGSTGAEVVELAVKLARYATGRTGTLALEGGYHGKTLGATALGGRPSSLAGLGELLPGVVHLPFPGTPAEAPAALEALAAVDGTAIGAVLIESLQGNAGQREAAPGFLAAVAAFARRHDAVLIADETQSAFGRTGAMFAFDALGLAPDLVIAGKGISSSLPLTVLLGRAAVVDAAPAGALSSTHGGNPVACAAACAVLDVLEEEDLPARARATGALLRDGLREAAAAAGLAVDVRGTGLMIGVHVLEDGPRRAAAIVRAAARRGLLLLAPIGLGKDVVRVAPPLVISREDAEDGLGVLAEVFAEVARA
jgi:4-aminobutyrate aminotransferase-like enzyme